MENKFYKYPEIENSYQQGFIDRIKSDGFGDMPYIVMEKVHGSNSQVTYNLIDKTFTLGTRNNVLSDEEKSFVLNNFFNTKFETMVYKNETYRNLYQKRFSRENFGIDDFNAQEYADLMAVFNLVWIDPVHFER